MVGIILLNITQMNTKIITTLLVVIPIFILAGCGSNSNQYNIQKIQSEQNITTDGKISWWVDATIYTMSQIVDANTEANCLTVINNNIYDLTAWVNQHPWGDRNILKICGLDGTSVFEGQHGGESFQEWILAGFQVGVLSQ